MCTENRTLIRMLSILSLSFGMVYVYEWKLIILLMPSISDGFTPLMIASCSGGGLETGNSEEEEDPSAEIISDFIYQGANLHNQTDRTGETALHLAARYARSDAAKRLLESSADANVQDNMGRTPLHAAVAADAQGVFQVPTCTFPVSHRRFAQQLESI